MAEPKRQPKLRCQIHFVSDRHVSQKLSQVYRWLVPEGDPPGRELALSLMPTPHEKDRRHLHPGLL
jgi:hypothetical protein